jgi:glutamate synthase (NADPH/NADH) large chain
MIKDETWYVKKGRFIYRWIDTQTAEVNEKHLTKGDTVRQYPGQPHQLIALSDGEILTLLNYCEKNDLKVLFNREVPVDTNALGKQALSILPKMLQIFVVPSSIVSSKRFDAMMYLARKEAEHHLKDEEDFYIPTFSSKVIAYKGLVMPTTIKQFYLDLNDEDFTISFALFHQRFSTNTLPKWRLAQPFRGIAHNGEINSIEADSIFQVVKTNGYSNVEEIK